MNYILNETNQIIAADDNLLELCGVSHIDELSLKTALGDTKFDLSEENIIITNDNSEKTFSMSRIWQQNPIFFYEFNPSTQHPKRNIAAAKRNSPS